MKTLIITLQFLIISLLIPNTVLAQRHFDREIGKMISSSATITCNSDSLLVYFDNIVKTNAYIDVRFDKVTIEQDTGYYFLLAVDEDKNVSSAYELILDNGVFYEVMSSEGGSTTITCSGCAVGCNPKKLATGEWACLPTCSPAECLKTVSIVIKD